MLTSNTGLRVSPGNNMPKEEIRGNQEKKVIYLMLQIEHSERSNFLLMMVTWISSYRYTRAGIVDEPP
jgi:hypothetical protein